MNFDFVDIAFIVLKIIGYFLIAAGWIFVFSLIFDAYRTRRRRIWFAAQKYITLLIQVPRNNEKSPLAAELMFASLHGIFRPQKERFREGSFQEHISFEIVSINKFIRFYVHVPIHLRDFVEGQIYAQYPTVEIVEVEDYTISYPKADQHFLGAEVTLNKPFYYPIKTFTNFEVDPLAGITAVLGKLEENEQIWVQLIIRPVDDNWQAKSINHINALRLGKGKGKVTLKNIIFGFFKLFFELAKMAVSPPQPSAKKLASGEKLAGPVEQAIKAIEEKATKIGFESKLRLMLLSPSPTPAMKAKLQSVIGAFKQFNAANLNGFVSGKISDSPEFLQDFKARVFDDQGFIFNIEELASIFHLPNITVETPNIVWAGAKKGEPPSNLPIEEAVPAKELTVFGMTDFRHARYKFGIKSGDRKKHIYVIGKTGVGKTTMLENMAMDDLLEGRGFAFVDPHGDSIDRILDAMPSHRINDVIYFNPGDRDFPVAFNPLETVDPDLRGVVASGFVGIFKKIFGFSWGPRLEYILRYAVLALLDNPGSTMMGILKMLVDKKYRDQIVSNVSDPVVRDFWNTEFAAYDQKFRTEAISPIQNKVGQFLSTPTIRNIVAQPTSSFNIREAMDNSKILLIKLSKGEIGEDNMALIGSLLITKIQLAAMSRVDVPEEQRKEFYLYVDEFQNFATDSFATIFSEARKYGLSLTVANQYMAQLSEEVKNAVFGNVGTIIAFRVGANDAPFLAKEFAPVFDDQDLVNLNKFHIYLKLSIDGITTPAFSALTLPPIQGLEKGNMQKVIAASRERYSRPRAEIEEKIASWTTKFESLPTESPKKKEEKEKMPEIKIPADIPRFLDIKGQNWYIIKNNKIIPSAESQTPQPKQKISQDKEKILQSKEIKPGEVIKF